MDHIIDGHNLISKLPGINLSMPDDEQHLVDLLISYCRVGGHRADVYFDGAPPGQARTRSHGRVRAHYIAPPSIADDAIRKQLARLGRAARNWLVVSSDRAVQQAGRELHAKVISSEEFAERVQVELVDHAKPADRPADELLSKVEVEEWEEIFRAQRKPKP